MGPGQPGGVRGGNPIEKAGLAGISRRCQLPQYLSAEYVPHNPTHVWKRLGRARGGGGRSCFLEQCRGPFRCAAFAEQAACDGGAVAAARSAAGARGEECLRGLDPVGRGRHREEPAQRTYCQRAAKVVARNMKVYNNYGAPLCYNADSEFESQSRARFQS